MSALIFAITFLYSALSIVLAAPTAAPTVRKRDIVEVIFPHFLVPAVQMSPDTTYATQYTAQINYTGSDYDMSETTMFGKRQPPKPIVVVSLHFLANNHTAVLVGFDVPNNNATNCLIKFTLPEALPGGYEWTAKGSGKFDVYMVTSPIVPGELSWNNRPQRYPTLDPTPLFRVTVCVPPHPYVYPIPNLCSGKTGALANGYIKQPTQGGEAAVDGYLIRCFNGQRMDFELVADHQAGAVEFDWFGTCILLSVVADNILSWRELSAN